MGTKRKARLEKMALLAVEDARMRVLMTREMPKTVYCKELGANQDNFARDWGKCLKTMLDQLFSMDKDGIGKVSMVVKSIRDAELGS